MKKIFLFLLICAFPLSAFSLKDKVYTGKSGDYLVTRQGSHYSLLLFHSLIDNKLILEEIDIPVNSAKNLNWKTWAREGAPNHSSWLIYEIDLQENKLLECYSLSREGWLHIDSANHFLTTLLSLKFFPTPTADRKRIGPEPLGGERDMRPIWNPKKCVNGNKIDKSQFSTFRSRWPKDGTQLADTTIEVYTDDKTFPFPYWIDINSAHYSFKLQGVDCGSGLSSIIHELPRRPFSFTNKGEWKKDTVEFTLSCPRYYNDLTLYAIDISEQNRLAIQIPISSKQWISDEQLHLTISQKDLKKHLVKGHTYIWACMSEKPLGIYREIEDSFHWPLVKNESYEQ